MKNNLRVYEPSEKAKKNNGKVVIKLESEEE
jgi:hypothetical protein